MVDSRGGNEEWPPQHVVVRDVAAMLFRRKWLILGIAALVIALAAAYSYTRPSRYAAKAEVLVAPVLSPLGSSSAKDTSSETETGIATSLAVADIARATLSSPLDAAALAKNATADMSQGSLILGISYSAGTPQAAQEGANAFANAYLSYREKVAAQSLQQKSESLVGRLRAVTKQIRSINARIAQQPLSPSVPNLRNQIVGLQASYVALQNQLVAVSSLTTQAGQVIQAASTPTSPASPQHAVDLAVGAFIGLILGIAIALVKDGPRHPLRYPGALEGVVGAPVLASIPRVRRRRACTVVTRDPGSQAAHSYRTLRTMLLARCEATGIKTILVTSANAGDGKTATAANLAAALAELGRQVVLISADLRRPRLDRALGFGKTSGLAEALQGAMRPRDAIHPTNIPNLLVVPAGVAPASVDPANLLQLDSMSEMLAACRSADFIILDSPPILEFADAIVIAKVSDAILFVADGKRTDGGDVALARHLLASTAKSIVGAVMTRADVASSYGNDNRTRGVVVHPSVPPIAAAEPSNGRPQQDDVIPDEARNKTPQEQV